jgi:hypothetical protein
MRRSVRTFTLSCTVFLVLAVSQRLPSETGDLHITGLVVDARTGTPIPGAVVIKASSTIQTVADTKGSFSLGHLQQGEHLLLASAAGYVSREVRYSLAASRSVNDTVIRLKHLGIISGRLFDRSGKPVVLAKVGLLRFMPGKGFSNFLVGKDTAELFAGSERETNDRGEYRIINVEPGQYQIAFSSGEPPATATPDSASVVPVLYPGVDDLAKAEVIEVVSGMEQRLTDVTLGTVRLGTLTVRLLNSGSEKEVEFSLAFNRAVASSTGRILGVANARGSILNQQLKIAPGTEIRRVFWPNWPGTYAIRAIWKNTDGSVSTVTKNVAFSGGNADVEVLLEGAPPAIGQLLVRAFVTDGGSPKNLAGLNVGIIHDSAGVPSRSGSRTDDGGMYPLEKMSVGHYSLYAVLGIPDGLYLANAIHNDRNVIGEGFVVTGKQTTLEIHLHSGTGTAAGIIFDRRGRTVHDALVVLIPESNSAVHSLVGYPTARTDQNGTFELKNVRPGAYRLYAWADAQSNRVRDATFMEKFESRGLPIQIQKTQKLDVSATILDEF